MSETADTTAALKAAILTRVGKSGLTIMCGPTRHGMSTTLSRTIVAGCRGRNRPEVRYVANETLPL